MRITDDIVFTDPMQEGLNSDVALQYMGKGDSPVDIDRDQYGRLNARSGFTSGQALGMIENIMGTKLVTDRLSSSGVVANGFTTHLSSLTGINKTLGWTYDTERNGLIWFAYNSDGEHGIYRYNTEYDAVEILLFQDASNVNIEFDLNFQKEYLINHARVIGDLLVWTDRYNEVGCVNIQDTRLIYDGIYDNRYAKVTENHIRLIKPYPPEIEAVTYETGTENYNNIRGKLFQFAYKYVYCDKMKSTLSQISKAGRPTGEELSYGSFIEYQTINNSIRLLIYTGDESVEAIEIYVREGNEGFWALAETINKYENDADRTPIIASNAYTTYYFDNKNKSYIGDQSELARPYDYIGKEVGCIEIVEDNRAVIADYSEGFDNLDIDVTLSSTLANNPLLVASPLSTNKYYQFSPSFTHYFGLVYWDEKGRMSTLQTSDDSKIYIDGYNESAPYRDFNYQRRVNWQIDHLPPQNAVKYGWAYSFGASYEYLLNFTLSEVTVGSSGSGCTVTVVFVKGEVDSLAVVAAGSGYSVGDVLMLKGDGLWGVKLKVKVTAIGGGGTVTTVDFVSLDNEYVDAFLKKGDITFTAAATKNLVKDTVYFDVDDEISAMIESQKNCTIENYIPKFQKGDRVAFISMPLTTASSTCAILLQTYDYEIAGIEGGKLKISANSASDLVTAIGASFIGEGTIAQIYRPRQKPLGENGEGLIYHITSDIYDIVDVGGIKYHGGVVDQTATIPATGTFLFGDTYTYLRFSGVVGREYFPCMSTWYSDYYSSNVYDKGKPTVYVQTAQDKRYNTGLRHGGKYLDNTDINFLNRFSFDDYETLNEKDGTINKLIYRGYELKCLQDSKNTAIYINRKPITSASGSQQLTITDKVFSLKNPHTENWGTINPESVVQFNNYIYYWDANQGKVIRDATNGLEEISRYKMKRFFRQWSSFVKKFTKILGNNYLLVKSIATGFYNEKYDEYGLWFYVKKGFVGDSTLYNHKTSAPIFSEPANRWKFFWLQPSEENTTGDATPSFPIIDAIGRKDNINMAWIDGVPYLLEEGTLYNKFFGTQYPQKIAVVGNGQLPNDMKTYMSCSMSTNNNIIDISPTSKSWEVPEIYIPPSVQYPDGMSSLLKSNNFASKNGKLFSDFKKDINTPNAKADIWNLINGRNLIGYANEVTFKNVSTDYVTVSDIRINSRLTKSGK